MRVFCRQHPTAKALQVRMRDDYFAQPFSQAQSTMLVKNEDIRQPGKRRIVCYHTGKANLLVIFEDTEAE